MDSANDRTTLRQFVPLLIAVLPVLAAITVATTAVTGTEVQAASLQTVASYQMNEGSGATVMRDSSGFGLDGSIGDDIVTGVQHSESRAYRWPYAAPDTSPLRPQRLAVVDDHQHLDPGSVEFAVEIRYRTDHRDGNIVQKGQSGTSGGYWKLEQNNGVPTCLFRRTTQNQAAVTGPRSLADGSWHTVRCVRAGNHVAMYIDGAGTPAARRNVSVGKIDNGFDLTIGGKSACNQKSVGCDYFSGDIDYVKVEKAVAPPDNQPPTSDFSYDCEGRTCTFDSSPSSDPDGTIDERRWEIENVVETTTTTTIEHTFGRVGSHTVALTVTDDDGAADSRTRTVVVEADTSVDASKFVPLPPARLFDTRPGESPDGYKGIVRGGTSLTVRVADRAGVPASGVTAVAINLAAIGVEAPSYVTATPVQSSDAATSSLNLVVPGHVRANLVVVPLNDDGTISLFSLRDAHLLGDVAGYFRQQPTESDDGRIVTQTPQRLFDTRTNSILGDPRRVPAGGTVAVDVLGRVGVPTDGVEAVVMNVTATAAAGPGYVTVWPDGQRPITSSLNYNGSLDTVANQVIVPVGRDGRVRFYSSAEVDLVADVLGWVTDDAAPVAATGLFVPLEPARVFDTREGEAAPGPKGIVVGGDTISPQIAGAAGVPADAGGVILNVTMVGTAPGYVTLWPTGAPRPTTSNVNVDRDGDVRPNGAILRLGDGGRLDVYVLSDAHVLADLAGYLLR